MCLFVYDHRGRATLLAARLCVHACARIKGACPRRASWPTGTQDQRERESLLSRHLNVRPLAGVCASCPSGEGEESATTTRRSTDLQQLQLLQPLLYQLLDLPLVLDRLVIAERIPRPPLGVFPKVVRRELFALSEELSVLYI